MRAVRYHEHGDRDVLQLETIDRPEPGPDAVSIDIRAASVNPIDTYLRAGGVSPAGGLPHVGGSDCAGVVEAVGDDVETFAPGDRVYATGLGVFSPGTYAEATVAPAHMVAPLPAEVSFVEGAAAAMAFATAWRALVDRGGLSLGDTALVHGASGGVGHAAVQVAAAAGAFVVGTAREGAPASFARSLGADAVVDYRDEAIVEAVREATGGDGVDVILESHADANLEADLELLNDDGAIVVIGEDGPIRLSPSTAMTGKQADADVRFMSIVASPAAQAPILERVGPRLADGTFEVAIDSTYPLSAAREAQARLFESGVLGKVVLDPTA
ncbi:MAG: NADPH:quinone reductase [Halobacteriota archaeon]